MIINNLELQNFKSILNQNLALAPLTIICGTNSSGKSSFLQSIAMLSQSARTKGEKGDFGTFDHILNKKTAKANKESNKKSPININLEFKTEDNEFINCRLSFLKNIFEKESFMPDYLKIEYITKNGEKIFVDNGCNIDDCSLKEIISSYDELYNNKYKCNINFENPYINYDDTRFIPDGLYFEVDNFDTITENFAQLLCDIPNEKIASIEEAEKYAEEKAKNLQFNPEDFNYNIYRMILTLLNDDDFKNIFNFNECFSDCKSGKYDDEFYEIKMANWYHVLSALNKDQKEKIKSYIVNSKINIFELNTKNIQLPKHLKYSCDLLNKTFTLKDKENKDESDVSGIIYLGHLLDLVKDQKSPVTPLKIQVNYDKIVKNYLSPDYFSAQNFNLANDKKLANTLIDWIKYFEIAENVKIENEEIILTVDGEDFTLYQLGTGVSQLIPILFDCLNAEPGSIIMLTEPEVHLHPKWQSKLADFFLTIALSGRQLLIETHSEYLIKSIRRNIAKIKSPDDDKIADIIIIYFSEKGEKGTVFKKITIDKYAYISEWPNDFFDEGEKSDIDTLHAINEKLKEDAL